MKLIAIAAVIEGIVLYRFGLPSLDFPNGNWPMVYEMTRMYGIPLFTVGAVVEIFRYFKGRSANPGEL